VENSCASGGPGYARSQDGGSLSVPRGVCGAAGLPVGLALQPLGTAASFATLPYWRFLPVVVVAKEDFGGFADERERMALSAKVLRSLHVQGRPLPLSRESLYM